MGVFFIIILHGDIMMSDEDLERFSTLLDITIVTARNAENTFLFIQQTLDFAKTYSKPKLDDMFTHLEFQLVQSYEFLGLATNEIEKVNHNMNAILSPDMLL